MHIFGGVVFFPQKFSLVDRFFVIIISKWVISTLIVRRESLDVAMCCSFVLTLTITEALECSWKDGVTSLIFHVWC
jgi:hypothetical protein